MVKNHSVKNWGCAEKSTVRDKTGDFYAGYKFRITPKFRYTLVVPESTVLSLADRWTRGPLSVSSSPSGSVFFLSPARFLHRRRLVCRASRPYRGIARRVSCRRSMHSPRGPARCRHCSRIHLRTPAIGDERRWWTSPTVHRARAIKWPGCLSLLPHTWPHFSSSFFLHYCSQKLGLGSNGGGDAGLVCDPDMCRAGDTAGALRAPVRDDP